MHRIGILDLNYMSSSKFFHHHISGSVTNTILKFYPDSLVLQPSGFSPIYELIGELKRMWSHGKSGLRKKLKETIRFPHEVIIEDFVNSILMDKEPLVPISDVLPTVRLIENIRKKNFFFILNLKN